MQKKKWKKITAFVLAAFMAVTLPNVPHNKYELRAENVNLFTDGDLGDDTSDDLWGESPWSFGSQSWNATNDVNYSEYAANGTASGLGIYYSAEGTVNLYETIASLEAGRYTLSGYVKDANGKGGSVQGYFGSTDNVSETFSITDSFQFFSFTFTIWEENSNCPVGLLVSSQSGAWVCLDTLSLTLEEPAVTGYTDDMEGDEDGWTIAWSKYSATAQKEQGQGNNTSQVWNFWSEDAQNVTITRKITGVAAGSYKVIFETAGDKAQGTVSLSDGSNSRSANMVLDGWNVYTAAETGVVTVAGNSVLTIAVSVDLEDGGYFKLDNIQLSAAADGETETDGAVSAEIYVDRLDLNSDFIRGVDVSSYISQKQSGVAYRNFDGSILDDAGFFRLLKDSGVNWVRIRVWNRPYDSSGNGYGGGNSDLEKAKTIGKLATDAGLKVLIDFHYSDFWADPAMQAAPKAWSGLNVDQKAAKVAEYTLNSLNTLRNAGVNVRMVQIGNETNNGICGVSADNWGNMAKIFNAGSAAVRSFEDSVYGTGVENGSEVMVALHFTEPHSGNQGQIAANLNANGVDYDVFATSYYPFWHGTLDNLNTVLSDIASTYGKKVMVAETSYAYTFEDGDGHVNNVRAENSNTLDLDYNVSVQGQVDAVSSIMKTISETTGGIGMFYWEPAWIPVQEYDAAASNAQEVLASNQEKWETYGSGWAASFSAEYDKENAGRYYGGSSWDNQALFDHNGNPLDSLNVFKYVDTGATTERRLDVVENKEQILEYGANVVLPQTVTGIYNDGTTEELAVEWNAVETAAIGEVGSYTVTGTAGGKTAICSVEVLPVNFLENGGFESGIGNGSGWAVNANGDEVYLIKLDTNDVKRGTNALKFDAWSQTITNAVITQTVYNLPAGTYSCYMNVEGAGQEGSYNISLSASGANNAGSDTAELLGWMNWDRPEVTGIKVAEGGSVTVSIGITTTALETWGTIDDVFLYRTGE